MVLPGVRTALGVQEVVCIAHASHGGVSMGERAMVVRYLYWWSGVRGGEQRLFVLEEGEGAGAGAYLRPEELHGKKTQVLKQPPLCDMPSSCGLFTGPWTWSSLRVLCSDGRCGPCSLGCRFRVRAQ